MPFKSKAQRRKFAELLVKGEITPETFEEWSRETGSAKLPERVSRERPRRKGVAAKTRRKGVAAKKRSTTRKPRKRVKKSST